MTFDYPAIVAQQTEAILAIARRTGPSAGVPPCPGWDLAALCGHLGRVQRWATTAVVTGSSPEGGFGPPPPAGDEALTYLADSVNPLVNALGALSAERDGWTFVGNNASGRFWPRRQAQEALIHRWDAESAAGSPGDFDPDVAADGLDEALTTLASFRLKNRKGDLPSLSGSLHLHATDATSEWMIDAPGGSVRISPTHGKGDAALRGTASDLLLFVWRRLDPNHPGFESFGDRSIVDEFYNWKLLG